jgi:hypothetical protein
MTEDVDGDDPSPRTFKAASSPWPPLSLDDVPNPCGERCGGRLSCYCPAERRS